MMKQYASVACQTEPNLIDKLVDNHVKKQLDDVDLYQEYVRSAQCAQFWPLDKNPIRSLVPSMVKVDLPEQYLKNESLMFDLVQAINNNSKLVNLLVKYIHHIVPNVIISKRIDLIPLITCAIRVCRDTNEQERLISLLFNLIKRPNEEQRRMILSGIIVVLQVSPHQSSSLLLPNLWDHVNDKFPERRILLAESCSTLAHYVRPVMRTNLILSILMQLLKDKNATVRSAACKSFSCLLTLIMDRNDEVFDACLSATEDIIQDVLQQTPVHFCEHRYELEQVRFCALETVYPLLCMWAVKLNRFKLELAEFYITKAEKYFSKLLMQSSINNNDCNNSSQYQTAQQRRHSSFVAATRSSSSSTSSFSPTIISNTTTPTVDVNGNGAMLTSQRAISAYLKMLNYLVPFVFSDAVHSCAWLSKSNLHLPSPSLVDNKLDESTNVVVAAASENNEKPNSDIQEKTPTINNAPEQAISNGQEEAEQMNDLALPQPPPLQTDNSDKTLHSFTDENNNSQTNSSNNNNISSKIPDQTGLFQLFDRPLNFGNKLLDPTLIIDESAIVAFHDQLEQEHMIESLDWILNKFLPKFLALISHFSHGKFYMAVGGTTDTIQEFLFSSISSTRQLCLLFGKHLTRTKIRPLIKQYITSNNVASLYSVYIASLTAFEPIEQQEFEEIVISLRQNLSMPDLTRNDVEILAISIKIIATNKEQIHSPSTRQKFLTYILDALVNYSNHMIRTSSSSSSSILNQQQQQSQQQQQPRLHKVKFPSITSRVHNKCNSNSSKAEQQETQTKEFMLIIFRHILTCLIDQTVRPIDWAHILVTKFLPLLISLANDCSDVYVCTYARLMCAQLVETFDTYLNSPKLTKQTANAIMPALISLKGLTEQIKASNLKRQIESLTQDFNEKFFKDENNNVNGLGK